MRVGGALHEIDELVERSGSGIRPLARDEPVDACEVQERGGDGPVLRGLRPGLDVAAHGGREEPGELRCRQRRAPVVDPPFRFPARLASQQPAGAARGAEAARRQLPRGVVAHDHLTRPRRLLGVERRRRRGPGDQQLPVRGPGDEDVHGAAVDADGHPQLHGGARRLDPADLPESPAHPDRGAGCARWMVVTVEEEQQRVAAELQESAALRIGDLEQRREARPDGVGELLRALRSDLGEALGQPREARDVDVHHRPVDRAHGSTAGVAGGSREHARHVGEEQARQGLPVHRVRRPLRLPGRSPRTPSAWPARRRART